jgi:hypothetical protein
MKRFILSENGLNTLKKNLIREASYEEHVNHGSQYLTANYKAIPYDDGKGKIVGVFMKLDNGQPTKMTCWKQDVLDALDKEFYNRITDDTERKGFISQLLDDWYNGGISKYGSLTKYNFN